MSKEEFLLYYTLNANLPSKGPSSSQIKTLSSKLSGLNEDNAGQVLRLIFEHAIATEEVSPDPTSYQLPYSMTQKGENVVIDVTKLPLELQWILIKFTNIIAPAEK